MSALPEAITPELLRGLRLAGAGLHLRPVVESDATPAYVSWLNDPETTRFMESGRRVETVESIADYIRRYRNRPDALFLAVVLNDSGRHVGNLKLEPINWAHRSAVVGIMIGAPEARGRGVGTEAMKLLLRFAFGTLKLHRVALGVTSDNAPAIRSYEKAGFRREGVFRESCRRPDGYVDGLWMAILDREFEALWGRGP